MLYYIILYYIILYYIILYYIILHYIILYYIILYYKYCKMRSRKTDLILHVVFYILYIFLGK